MEKLMMKRMAMFFVCVSSGFAGYSDGFITAGKYEYAVRWSNSQIPLIVDGGADEISVRDYGRLIVKSTSKPLTPGWEPSPGGVYDILLYNTSQLLYLDGVTEYIRVGQNATAVLKGGSINCIKTMRYPVSDEANVFIYAQDGWSWINDDPWVGIQGNWKDGTPFNIQFINDFDYGPVWQNIQVIPEPATLVLLATGGVMLQRKKRLF
jgi:hypothetical protein